MATLTLSKELDLIPFTNKGIKIQINRRSENDPAPDLYMLAKILCRLYDTQPFNMISVSEGDVIERAWAEISVQNADEAKKKIGSICASEKVLLKTSKISSEKMMTFRCTSQILDFLFISAPVRKKGAIKIANALCTDGYLYFGYSFRRSERTTEEETKILKIAKRTDFIKEG